MFSMSDTGKSIILHGEYSISIVILSIVIACLASFTAITMNDRIRQNSFFHRNLWLSFASIAMGLGVWSMHFIGMSAVNFKVPMEYDLVLTIASVFPPILASYLAFYISNRTQPTQWSYVIASIIMGLGIASMHYMGMFSMKMQAQYYYKPLVLLLSIAVAIIVSYVALYVFSMKQRFNQNYLVKLVTSLLMGLAIASMHYIGMEAIVFYVDEPLPYRNSHQNQMDIFQIAGVTVSIFVILGISTLSGLLDRYVDYRLTYYDMLTSLPNRRQFEKMLQKTAGIKSLAVIHLHDLEKWNSRYGYVFGDEIIKAAGELIHKLKPSQGNLYRIEGNRFAILTEDDCDFEKLKSSMEKIAACLCKKRTIGVNEVIIDMVCAVTTANGEEEQKSLFANVLAVLEYPSLRYKHEVIEYNSEVHADSFEKHLKHDIENAIAEDELFLVYQPKVSPETNQLHGVEALLRWNHSSYGFISPGVFIPILEETGQIFDVTDWLIDHVCKQISLWKERDGVVFQVAINIPGSYFTSGRLMKTLKDAVSQYNINSGEIELEITETSVINNIESAIRAIREFREIGFMIALDDFGTGVSSLSYLKRLPITTLKIDKSFVDDVPISEKDSAIIRAIINLGHSLDLKVVLEGVESQEQVDFLLSIADDTIIQGYYFSKPMGEAELVEWAKREMPVTIS
ncbi:MULTISPECIES: EAL domain-containing protein [unclassified Bacillus (in: firmicutes)]|uniref:bifunctional diguanylate cyclase/phosphodiesterase n=1 Tax=unclassified Bacillus (in: firmicutes) TaxID=185979 RepID=UPI0008E1FEA9|nr:MULTISPECIES: EAL domain-containing protein [unclassified Bacillus (in: firmicutes)]SFB04509.1 EAL domain, c-di-GMP-specific phosphodiesterase class I (or its enzymatically inactive variant) [Bacillus sp. UNCCL13]SFQ88496.1 EAL domain, c-di-GMP-specific phosphodiesterase class I (or its enzymatically inactive variant) [Bacillus sp. cl95]